MLTVSHDALLCFNSQDIIIAGRIQYAIVRMILADGGADLYRVPSGALSIDVAGGSGLDEPSHSMQGLPRASSSAIRQHGTPLGGTAARSAKITATTEPLNVKNGLWYLDQARLIKICFTNTRTKSCSLMADQVSISHRTGGIQPLSGNNVCTII